VPTSTNFGYLLYFTPVNTMPPESASPKFDETSDTAADNTGPRLACDPEIVSGDSTFALYQEAIAETQTVVRDEAKAILKQRICEVEQLRTTLARAEEELAKLLKKTPEEIASIRMFKPSFFDTDRMLRQLRGSSEQSAYRSMGLS
jgi:hypothetical protein